MVAEVVECLLPEGSGTGRRVADMTVGSGGHAAALLDAGVEHVIGFDRDPEALRIARERLAAYGDRFTVVHRRVSPVGGAAATGPRLLVRTDAERPRAQRRLRRDGRLGRSLARD